MAVEKLPCLKILLGEEVIDSGEVFFLSSSTKIGYLSQDIIGLDTEKAVLDIFDINQKKNEENYRLYYLIWVLMKE